MNNTELQSHSEQLERLVQRAKDLRDPEARSTALELLQSVMDLHGAVFTRMMEILLKAGEPEGAMIEALAADPVVSGMLVLYGLHPHDLERRVMKALDESGRHVHSRGGELTLVELRDSHLRLKLDTGKHGEVLRQAVEKAIIEAAPDLNQLTIEIEPAIHSGFVPLSAIRPVIREEKSYEKSAA